MYFDALPKRSYQKIISKISFYKSWFHISVGSSFCMTLESVEIKENNSSASEWGLAYSLQQKADLLYTWVFGVAILKCMCIIIG